MVALKIVAWAFWCFHALVSMTFLGLAVTTGNNIRKVYNILGTDTVAKDGLMASIVLGFIIVLFFLVFSPVIMLGKHFGSNLTLSYGIMLGTCSHSAWFMLLAGLVLNAWRSVAQALQNTNWWSSTDYSAYQATFGFAYILCGTFTIMCVVLFFCRRGLGREEEYTDDGKPQVQMQNLPASNSAAGTNVWPPPGAPQQGGGGGAWGTSV